MRQPRHAVKVARGEARVHCPRRVDKGRGFGDTHDIKPMSVGDFLEP